jgi:hypothetical protein
MQRSLKDWTEWDWPILCINTIPVNNEMRSARAEDMFGTTGTKGQALTGGYLAED